MADLPSERLVKDLPPFSNVGLDYFGPFEVRKGRGTAKRHGVLFTCMTSHAVHLEVAFNHGLMYQCHKEISMPKRSRAAHKVR